MCRWLAYSGPAIFLDSLLVKPEHSLLMQSRFARENYVSGVPDFPEGAIPTNGDGFGFGWYGERDEPGLYRELRPAWSDENLLSLAANIRSGLFLAHLRAAYDGIVQRTNSHPFRRGRWLFQHNGGIPGFSRYRRELCLEIEPRLYPELQGTTDSEVCFYLALTAGLDDDPRGALEAMTGLVEAVRGGEEPFQLTCALSDGEAVYAVRYSSNSGSKSLYVNQGAAALKRIGADPDRLPESATVVLSEPLTDCTNDWRGLPESVFVEIRGGEMQVSGFEPRGWA